MTLINADMIVHWQSYDDEHETFPEHEGTITEFLDAMTDEGCPETVDAVEVVRCKDCRFHGYNTYTKVHYCRRPNVVLVIKENDFCKYGERKDGEANENH